MVRSPIKKYFIWKFPWGAGRWIDQCNDHPHNLYFIIGGVDTNVWVISVRATRPVAYSKYFSRS